MPTPEHASIREDIQKLSNIIEQVRILLDQIGVVHNIERLLKTEKEIQGLLTVAGTPQNTHEKIIQNLAETVLLRIRDRVTTLMTESTASRIIH